MDDLTRRWIATTLVNDEASTDAELREHFEREGGLSPDEAAFYVSQRNEALRDTLHFQLRIFAK
jgi:hypothetical protein